VCFGLIQPARDRIANSKGHELLESDNEMGNKHQEQPGCPIETVKNQKQQLQNEI